MSVQSTYWRTSTGKIQHEIFPEKTEEHTRLFIRNTDPLTMDFDPETGTFRTMPQQSSQKCYTVPSKTEKEYLRSLQVEHRKTSAQIQSYTIKFPNDYDTHPKYIRLERLLSILEDKITQTLNTIALSVARKIYTLVKYYARRYPNQHIRVQVGDLQRSRTPLSPQDFQSSYFINQHYVLTFYRQVQYYLVSLLYEVTIGVWRVDAGQCPQLCAQCGYPGQNQDKQFRCTNENHKNAQGNYYTCDARLNSTRNHALFPPISAKPLSPEWYD